MQQRKEVEKALRVTKNELRNYCKNKILQSPHLRSKITEKLIQKALIFIEGYARAIESDIMLPIVKKEVNQLLLEQGFIYIERQIS